MNVKVNKKILICIEWFTPAFRAGGPIRSIENLVQQINGGIDYYIFCSNRDLNNESLSVNSDTWLEYNKNTKVFYASNIYLKKKFLQLCDEILPDVIYINGLYSIPFNVIPIIYGKSPTKIIAPRGMLHKGALQQKKLKKKLFFLAWKGLRLHKKVVFHATNEMEKKAIQLFFKSNTQVTVAENIPHLYEFYRKPDKEKGKLHLVSVALISPMKNHHLVLEALIHCQYNIHYSIVGPVKDASYWDVCKSLISKMPENITVDFLGELPPEEIEHMLKAAHVFILPSESENYAHAIIEALSSGCPVITSHHTPWNNLANCHAGINVALNQNEVLKAVNYFADMDSTKFGNWSEMANDYINESVLISDITTQYKSLFKLNQ